MLMMLRTRMLIVQIFRPARHHDNNVGSSIPIILSVSVDILDLYSHSDLPDRTEGMWRQIGSDMSEAHLIRL